MISSAFIQKNNTGESPVVMAVVVAYERRWEEILAAPWLLEELRAGRISHLVVYDNSPAPTAMPPTGSHTGIEYVHDSTNGGTRAAYLHAFTAAQLCAQAWVLLLDHDTKLPSNYLEHAFAPSLVDCDIRVPRVRAGSTIISPATISWAGSIKPCKDLHPAAMKRITAIASGTLLKGQLLSLLAEAPKELWLDYLDHWFFQRIHKDAHRVGVLDVELAHNLSILDPGSVPDARLRSIWTAERLFIASLPLPARLVYRLRLAARLLRFLITCRRCARTLVAGHWSRGPRT